MKRIAPQSLLCLCLVGWIPVTAAETPWVDKVHPSLLQVDNGQPAEFIVVLDEQADVQHATGLVGKQARGEFVFETLQAVAARSQRPLIEMLEAEGAEYRSYWIANIVWVRGDRALLPKLAARADVRRLDANPRVRMDRRLAEVGSTTASIQAVEPNIQQIHADQVWALGYDGTGIVVGGADTGYFWSHPAIRPKYRGWDGLDADHNFNWHDTVQSGGGSCGSQSPEPCDDFFLGHGTHTMGTMVGDDGAGNQIGISPGSTWIGCRNMAEGVGTAATYAECFQWFLAPTDLNGQNANPALAPHVINNSWVCLPSEGCSDQTLRLIVENTIAAGIVVVASAGNEGDGETCSSIEYPPAIYDAAITVGAADQADEIMIFSSVGPVTVDHSHRIKPDVAAPGLNVRSALTDGTYGPGSGTSIAGPHVAAVVALLLSARDDLIGDVATVQKIIKTSAFPRTSTRDCGGFPGAEIPNPIYGWGRVDALEALLGDADLDGTDNLTDCKPTASDFWAVPGPVTTLALDHDGVQTTLTWTEPSEAGGSRIVYDLLRSSEPEDFSAATCILADSLDPIGVDDEAVADIRYYLVRTKNVCGANLGAGTDAVPRAGVSCDQRPLRSS